MKVIMTFTVYCDNLLKGKFMALKKPAKLVEFFLLICRQPVLQCFNGIGWTAGRASDLQVNN